MEAIDNKDFEEDIPITEVEAVQDEELDAAEMEIEDEPESEERIRTGGKGFLYDLIFYAVLIFVCIYILPNFVIQRTIVDGSSMAETLHDGEHLYVEKLSYRFNALDRFDIIVFYPYGRDNEEYYVKRIIGMPGETIQIIGSDIYINGEILEEHYGKDPITEAGRAANPITLGEDEYFVMGDNRSVSKDSRSESVGNVQKENIGGRAIFRIKPLSRFGTID
jgi:signal peptidase I